MRIDTVQNQHTEPKSNELAGEFLRSNLEDLRPSQSKSSTEQEGHQGGVQQSPVTPDQTRFQGHSVVRPPQQLHLHPVLLRLNLADSAVELNQVIRMEDRCLREPILITTNGTIISGFSKWRFALKDSRPAIDCIEYSLSDEEAIEFMLIRHQPRRVWNNFTRIRLALELESYFQVKALANQIAGGKYKGSANLPKAEHIDVRQEIARVAGTGSRNVTNIKTILHRADSRLLEALQAGTLSIHRALQWCSLSQRRQMEEFTRYSVERATSKIIRQVISRNTAQATSPDPLALLNALLQKERQKPGSIVVRPSRGQQTIIFMGQDLLRDSSLQIELGES